MEFFLISSLSFGISALVTLILSLILWKVFFQNRDKNIMYLAGFIGVRFFMFLSVTLVQLLYVLTKDAALSGITFSFFFVFMFISFLFPPFLFTIFKWQGIRNYYFALVLILSLAGIIFALLNIQPVVTSNYQMRGSVSPFLPAVVVYFLYPMGKLISILPLTILFLIYAIRKTRKIRLKSLLMGIGFLWVISTIIIPFLLPPLFSGIYACIADILIFAGAMVKIPKGESGLDDSTAN